MPATSRLTIPYPASTDSPNGPVQMQALANALDGAAIYGQGALASRPTSTSGSPGIQGRLYYATDNGTVYWDFGTGWIAVGTVADGAVTTAKLAANAVTSAKIVDGTIEPADLSTDVMLGHRIESGRITGITAPASGATPNYVDVTITFGTAFSSVPALLVTIDEASASPDSDGAMQEPLVNTSTVSGATVRLRRVNNSAYSSVILNWIAIGS